MTALLCIPLAYRLTEAAYWLRKGDPWEALGVVTKAPVWAAIAALAVI